MYGARGSALSLSAAHTSKKVRHPHCYRRAMLRDNWSGPCVVRPYGLVLILEFGRYGQSGSISRETFSAGVAQSLAREHGGLELHYGLVGCGGWDI